MSRGRAFGVFFGWTNNEVHITTLSSSHSRSGFHSNAVIRDVRSYRLRDDINKIDSLDDALGLYHEMSRMRPLPCVIDFTRLLGRVVKMKHSSSAIAMYKDMCVKSIPVNDYTLSIIISCFCLEGKVDFGLSMLGAFFKHGIVPNATAFNNLLKGLFRENRASDAKQLFQKIIYHKLCLPNEIMMGTVIDGLSKVGNTDLAVEFLRLMKNDCMKPNVIMYNTIIDCLCKDKMMDKALALLREMIEEGIAPDVITYSCLIRGFCSLGKWKEVKRLWVEMLGFDIAPDVVTYSILIDSFSKHGLMKDANDVLETMVQRGEKPNVVTYSALMDGYCMLGELDEARRIFDVMVSDGIVPDEVTYNIIVQGLLEGGKYDDVVTYLDKMVEREFRLHSRNTSRVLELISEKENAPAPFRKMIQRFQNYQCRGAAAIQLPLVSVELNYF